MNSAYVRILQMKQDKPVTRTFDCASAITPYLTRHQINRFDTPSENHRNITAHLHYNASQISTSPIDSH